MNGKIRVEVNENELDLWAIEKTMEAKVKRRLYGDSTYGDSTLHRGEKYGILLPVI